MWAKQIVRANFNLKISHRLTKKLKLCSSPILLKWRLYWHSSWNIWTLGVILIFLIPIQMCHREYVLLFGDVSFTSFIPISNRLTQKTSSLMSFCNVREHCKCRFWNWSPKFNADGYNLIGGYWQEQSFSSRPKLDSRYIY